MAGELKKLINFLKSEFVDIDDSDAIDIIGDIRKGNNGLKGLNKNLILNLAKPMVKWKLKQKISNQMKKEKKQNANAIDKDVKIDSNYHIDYKRNRKSCKFCFRIFSSTQAMERHEQNIHNEDRQESKCSVCDRTFKTKESLKNHTKLDQCDADNFKCDACGKSFRHKKDLKLHTIQHSEKNNQKIECDDCGKGFSRKSNLFQHRQNVHALWNVNFDMARKRLKQEDGSYQCKVCKKEFSEKASDQFDKHVASRCCKKGDLMINEWCRFQCNLCEKSYKDAYSLRKHINWKHSGSEPGPFKCKDCEKEFVMKKSLRRHIKSSHTKLA